MNLHDFTDIHTHRLDAGASALINLPWGMEVPAEGSYSVGIHPWDTENVSEADFERLARLARHPNIVAIGECGLDALRGAPMEEQERVFRRHVELSEELGKPLIIHAVRTLPRIMHLRKALRPSQRWIIHGYRGNAATAAQLMRLGFDISIGARYNPEILTVIPPDRLFHETDNM